MSKNTTDFKTFNYLENGDVHFSALETIRSTNKLDAGVYNIRYEPYPKDQVMVALCTDLETTKHHNFPDKERLDRIFASFFTSEIRSKINSLGFYHKLGLLLYGKEGSGKSTIIKHYYSRAVKEHEAIVFMINEKSEYISNIWQFILRVRKIQSNPIVIILEEMEVLCSKQESYMKSILDGNLSIDNCMFFGSTNYFESIPAALRDRPSRFKYCINIESIQSETEVLNIVSGMLTGLFEPKEIKAFAKDLSGSTLDYIKQFCLDKIMDIETFDSGRRSVIGFQSHKKAS